VALLEVRGLTVRFGGHTAVTEVDLDVERGCVTGLIGPNGAGKTTIFNAITGLQPVSGGTLKLHQRDITRSRPRERARLGIARTFQHLEVFGTLTARENILVAAEIRRRWGRDLGSDPTHDTETILDRVGLREVADERADTLPTGLARLCELGRALAARPRVLLLDEPASGLSDHETRGLVALLRELAAEGMAVLLVEHDVGLVMEVCGSVHVLNFGALLAVGTSVEIRRNQAVLDAYLGSKGGGTRGERARPSPPIVHSSTDSSTELAAHDRDREQAATPVLELRNIHAAYRGIEVLRGVNLAVPRGGVVALLGPNGAGKTTALRIASRQMVPTRGCVHLAGRHVNGVLGQMLPRVGLCTIPEGRGVFPNLTVRENLTMASYAGGSESEIEERAFGFFPRLGERRTQLAGTLSGGEQQMLAVARALATDPAVLLLDELSNGLAPMMVEELYGMVAEIAREGVSILVVEQFARAVLGVADVAVVMTRGRVTAAGPPAELEAGLASAYLGASL
jgi:ABC-type branched-subunit amino acid transport system ATPase component